MSSANMAPLSAIIAAGEIAIELWHAENTVAAAKAKYHERIRFFETWHGRSDSRINPDRPEHTPVIMFTKNEYQTYQVAKRKAYNVRRRLNTASRKAADLSDTGSAS